VLNLYPGRFTGIVRQDYEIIVNQNKVGENRVVTQSVGSMHGINKSTKSIYPTIILK
jgi:hypothetical protein